ncbi:MAG: DUF4403 family protein [Chitinophagaceae bacterium]|nr:DUF4403 family protein [Chitinophagaceae bacterium]
MLRAGISIFISIILLSCSRKIHQPNTFLIKKLNIDSLPESEINIPIQISLSSIRLLAEQNVDTIFTSPNWPEGWITDDCTTRYKYYFRRSPLRISATGTTFNMAFTGFYKIIGSTRACAGKTVLSPWTPPCRCGFDEGERRVNVGFTSSFTLRPDYILNIRLIRNEPQPLDKCNVCFWGQDITKQVMIGLKEQLDLAKKAIEDSFSTVNIRPYLQQAWNKLSEVYIVPGIGYLSLHPKKLHMENITATNDLLNINLGIAATPVISFEREGEEKSSVPDLSPSGLNGFNIHLEAALQYDSLSKVVNQYLINKRFDFEEGFIKKHVIIKNVQITGNESRNLIIRVAFTGSHDGVALFSGTPVFNSSTKKIEVPDLNFDLNTKSLLLKTAKWLFNERIKNEIKKYTSFDLTNYYVLATKNLNTWLNREWSRGIKGSGTVHDLKITALHTLPQHLLVRSNVSGNLSVLVSEVNLKF